MKKTIVLLLTLLLVLGLTSFAFALAFDSISHKISGDVSTPHVAEVQQATIDELRHMDQPLDFKSSDGYISEIACGVCPGQHYIVRDKGAETSRTKYGSTESVGTTHAGVFGGVSLAYCKPIG